MLACCLVLLGEGVHAVQAVRDFEARIRQYEKVYQPLTDGKSNRHIHFIQLVNMVTGRGHMDINRISGYIPGKIVFFLMQARPGHVAHCKRLTALVVYPRVVLP